VSHTIEKPVVLIRKPMNKIGKKAFILLHLEGLLIQCSDGESPRIISVPEISAGMLRRSTKYQ